MKLEGKSSMDWCGVPLLETHDTYVWGNDDRYWRVAAGSTEREYMSREVWYHMIGEKPPDEKEDK